MQIVIDIDDELYEGIETRDGDLETEYVCDELMKAIDNGTPLPKHGRLIDADKLYKPDRDEWLSSKYAPFISTSYASVFAEIDNAPTIIGADKESEVEE